MLAETGPLVPPRCLFRGKTQTDAPRTRTFTENGDPWQLVKKRLGSLASSGYLLLVILARKSSPSVLPAPLPFPPCPAPWREQWRLL